MGFVINLKQTEAILSLTQEGQVIDSESFSYYHDLDRVLITVIDKLLKAVEYLLGREYGKV
jgi:hypothetical protein